MTNEKSTTNLLRYGKRADLPAKISLQAGQLSLVYENGFIRYIKAGETEVLRMINHAVRDHNWGTVPLSILSEEIERDENSFVINYQAEARQADLHFLWNCRIEGRADSSITFHIEGEAKSDFKRNRVGFTVLHPIRGCAGREVTLIHPDGTTESNRFPELISPHQPFFDLQAVQWEIAEGGRARLEFSGDIFETEDQRNWLDDSYKTYCTPLRLPFPILLKTGDQVQQSIRLSVSGISAPPALMASSGFHFSLSPIAYALPEIGIGQSSEVHEYSNKTLRLLQALAFDHYQVDVKLYETDWQDQWNRGLREAEQLGLPLELSLFFDNIALELTIFVPHLEPYRSSIAILNIFNRSPHATQENTLQQVLPILRTLLPNTRIGAGTNAFFTELNRDRTPAAQLDFVVYAVNPQVHAFDNGTLVENLNTFPYTINTAKNFSHKPVHISPITFKMRWNPNATGKSILVPGQLPEDVEVRQISLFGAAWVLGCFHQLLAGGAAAVSFFQTIGLRGILQADRPLLPDQFPVPAAAVYPMYFVFKTILDGKNHEFFPIKPSDTLVFTGLAFRKKGVDDFTLLLANFTERAIRIQLPSEWQACSARILHSDNIYSLMQAPADFAHLQQSQIHKYIDLPPFGMGFITVGTKK